MFPIFIPPNISQNGLKPLFLADGTVITAQKAIDAFGGLGTLRLTCSSAKKYGEVTTTESKKYGKIICLTFPSLQDVEGRITFAAVLVLAKKMEEEKCFLSRDEICRWERFLPGLAAAIEENKRNILKFIKGSQRDCSPGRKKKLKSVKNWIIVILVLIMIVGISLFAIS